MFREFEVSAPGKVILHGEHSVVYGRPAIAGVVQVRNYLRIRENESSHLNFCFQRLGLHLKITTESINNFIKSQMSVYKDKTLPAELDHDSFFEATKVFVQNNCKDLKDSRELNSMIAANYLLVGIFMKNKIEQIEKGFKIELETEMSIGAGLGSSASFGVCLAGAFVILAQLYINPDLITNPNKETLEEISNWAFHSEKIMHGNPSGLDNTICTFGNIVKFYKGKTPTNIDLSCQIPILLVDTKVSRSTATLVKKVLDLKTNHPQLVESIFDAMGHLVEDAEKIINELKSVSDDQFKALDNLVYMNNNLLRSIGVSHSELEKIFITAEKYGFKAKLSGAGGGGFAMILLSNDVPSKITGYEELKQELIHQRFELIETNLGGAGILIKSLN